MKFFSLESNITLVVWSVIFGLGASKFVNRFITKEFLCPSDIVGVVEPCFGYGWPLTIKPLGATLPTYAHVEYNLYNFIFWVLVAIIILVIIRNIRSKKANQSVSS